MSAKPEESKGNIKGSLLFKLVHKENLQRLEVQPRDYISEKFVEVSQVLLFYFCSLIIDIKKLFSCDFDLIVYSLNSVESCN